MTIFKLNVIVLVYLIAYFGTGQAEFSTTHAPFLVHTSYLYPSRYLCDRAPQVGHKRVMVDILCQNRLYKE